MGDPGAGKAFVVDPGDEAERILAASRSRGWKIDRIFLTHGHADHTGATVALRQATGARVAGPEKEQALFDDPMLNMATWLGLPFQPVALDDPVRLGQMWQALDREWVVLDTPGHTPGHVSLYCESEEVLFCGDVLFAGSVGRTDLPGASQERLAHTLRETLFTLPDSVRVYPGHGPSTTLGQERKTNPFVREVLGGASPNGSPHLPASDF